MVACMHVLSHVDILIICVLIWLQEASRSATTYQTHQKKMVAFDELIHELHPNHKLKLISEGTPYRCDSCKELGFHLRYTCEEKSCSFHLHKGCAEASPSLSHDFYKNCRFLLKSGMPRRVCDACGMDVNGSIYHCYDCGKKDLHPCCAHLERKLIDGDVELQLKKEMPSECYICGKKKVEGVTTWGYVSACKTFSLHISCVKQQMLESWMSGIKSSSHCKEPTKGMEEVAEGDGRALVKRRTPVLQLAVGETKRVASTGKFSKIKKMAQIAITVIVAALLGDPTALLTGLFVNLITHH